MPKLKEEIDLTQIPPPKGKYTIELSNPKKSTRERIEADNYVTPAYYRRILHQQGMFGLSKGWIQGSTFDRSFPAGNSSVVPNIWAFNPHNGPVCPDSCLITSDWSQSEDTNVDWAKGNIKAFATVWKATVAASGRRGLINESECVMSPDMQQLKYVWDWTTQQGNGEFQSVILGSILGFNHPTFTLATSTRGRAMSHDSLGVSSVNHGSLCFDPDNGDAYCLAFLATSGSTPRILNWTAADFADDTVTDGSGLWWRCGPATVLSTPPNVTFTNSTSSSTSIHYLNTVGMVKVPSSSDMIMVTRRNNGDLQISRFNVSTGASVYNNIATGAPAGETMASNRRRRCGAVIVGGKLYVMTGTYTTSTDPLGDPDNIKMMRFEPSTGAFEANIPLPTGQVGWGCLATDGTNLLASTNEGLLVLSTAGSPQSPYNLGHVMARMGTATNDNAWDAWVTGSPSNYGIGAQTQENMVSPGTVNGMRVGMGRNAIDKLKHRHSSNPAMFAGSADGTYPSNTEGYGTGLAVGSLSIQTPGGSVSQAPTPYLSYSEGETPQYKFHDGKLWFEAQSWYYNLTNWGRSDSFPLCSVDGSNMMSRARLDSPVTKTASQNMKITYEITLPDEWYGVIPHINPLA